MNKVAIIILNKSNNELLFDCLTSIKEKTSFKNYHIYLGDTGSTKEEVAGIKAFIKKNFAEQKNVTYIQFDYYNFAKNNNVIIREYVKDENLLLFCNNDIKLIDDCISEAVKMYDRNPDITGTIGFKLIFKNETLQHAGQMLILHENNQFAHITHRGLKENKDLYSGRERVIGNTMALMLTPKSLYLQLGGLNESYLDCFEDVEYNLNCIIGGRHNIYIGDRAAWHYESQTRDVDPNKMKKLNMDANQRLIPFIHKHIIPIVKTGLARTIP